MNKETKTKISVLKAKRHSTASKFEELEKDCKEKEKIINNLNGEVSYLSEKLGKIEESTDAHQRHSLRNCLLFYGIEKTKCEDTDNIVLEVLNSYMDLNISNTALDRSNRIGNPKSKKSHDQSTLNLFDIIIEETYL